ncbi:MAG: esterase family protein [Saprospiraceae bacterium]|nr:esterase family protein [Saprospiraceae bacterium]
MRKFLFVLMMGCSLITTVCAQGQLFESLGFNSRMIGKKMNYSIYLPEGYNTSSRSYPVLYLLHGYTDNETGWTQFGEIEQIANKMMDAGEATPMIIVMPDGGVSWYINNFDRSVPYEDYFFQEFMPFVESTYRIRKEKKYRAVSGLSMGGYGSFMFAIKHPDMFSYCAPLSAAFFEESSAINTPQANYDRTFAVLYGPGLAGANRINDTYKANDPYRIISDTSRTKALKTVKYYLDCGDDDFLSAANAEMHKLMLEKGITHEFRMRDGVHNWTYWRYSIQEVLKEITKGFHQ